MRTRIFKWAFRKKIKHSKNFYKKKYIEKKNVHQQNRFIDWFFHPRTNSKIFLESLNVILLIKTKFMEESYFQRK